MTIEEIKVLLLLLNVLSKVMEDEKIMQFTYINLQEVIIDAKKLLKDKTIAQNLVGHNQKNTDAEQMRKSYDKFQIIKQIISQFDKEPNADKSIFFYKVKSVVNKK